MKKSALLSFVLIIIYSSCSIEKRHYMSGFYISYKSKPEVRNDIPETLAVVASNKDSLSAEKKFAKIRIKEEKYLPEVSAKVLPEQAFLKKEFMDHRRFVCGTKGFISKNKTNREKRNRDDGKKPNLFALSGFVLSFFVPIVGLAFSIIGLVQIKNNPDKYWGKGFAIAGIIIDLLAILIVFAIVFLFL